MTGMDEIIDKYKIYQGGNVLPFHIGTSRDLVPYYPYIVVAQFGNIIRLSEESYIDKHEREYLQFDLDSAKSYIRRAKRPLNVMDVANHIAWGFSPYTDHLVEIAKRVVELGDKATIDGIHTESWDRYRTNLYKEMVACGWNDDDAYKWCFGFHRWIEKVKVE